MNRKFTLLAFFLFLTTLGFAQPSMNVGHLTIFSENGDKFYLILNGEKQNDEPQTNLRLEDLNQPYYNARIIFADKTLSDIVKNNLQITDVDGVFKDVTYKIKRDKNIKTKMKMNFFSMIDVRPDFIPPSSVYVVHYGEPRPQSVGYNQTTTTTTTAQGVNVGANVNIGGVNMNVSIQDPIGGTSVTETTTTHSSSGFNNNNQNYNNDEPRPRGCVNRAPMNNRDFSSAFETVKKLGFDETRLKTAKQIVSNNCMNTNQISQICGIFGFEESKLDFAKFAYEFCVEPKNYFKINNVFGFSSSVDDLNDYIQNRN
jgi:hypothetical protein